MPYARYPKENIKRVSFTDEVVTNLKYLRTRLQISPYTTPITMESIVKRMNLPMILKGVAAVNYSPFTKPDIVVKRMMATASLTMPSPKIKLKSLGCSSYLMIEIAAITSDEQSNELTSKQ